MNLICVQFAAVPVDRMVLHELWNVPPNYLRVRHPEPRPVPTRAVNGPGKSTCRRVNVAHLRATAANPTGTLRGSLVSVADAGFKHEGQKQLSV